MTSATPDPAPDASGQNLSALLRWLGPLGAPSLVIVLIGLLATVGRVEGNFDATKVRIASVAAAYYTLLIAVPVAGAYLFAGVGFGRLLRPVIGASRGALWIQAAAGVGMLLWISHLMGVAGLLSGKTGPYWAVGVLLVGLGLFVHQVLRGDLRPEQWPVAPGWIMLASPGLAIMLVAACSPPGWLWESEKGGFDVRSYHLQLAREWADGRGIEPLAHNVYSYLPGYMEAAFTHIGALTRLGDALKSRAGAAAEPALIGGSGFGVLACQVLHAGLGLLTALLVGRVVHALLTRTRAGDRGDTLAAVIAAASAVSVPWVIVVGSMAYNELAVTALGAGALLAAVDVGASPWRRAVIVGLLVGLACSAKPTAAFLVTPWVGLALLGHMPAKRWPAAVAVGSAAGLAAMAPWMARNYAAAGNPVFPFGTSIFGRGGWTAEQLARYAGAHGAETGADRLGLLFSADRGVLHPQWALLFVIALLAGLLSLALRPHRRAGALLVGGTLAALAAWLMLTHVQSRFLVPLVVPMTVLVGLATGGILRAARDMGASAVPRAALGIGCAALPVALAGQAAMNFAGQMGSRPNALLVGGVADLTGASLEEEFAVQSESEQADTLARAPSPELYCNLGVDYDKTVYLLGDSTPLYFKGRVRYHTTWDASPLGNAIRGEASASGDDARWVAALRGEGIEYVLVNMSELDRLSSTDRWYDPAVTPEVVRRFMGRWGDLVRAWPQSGQALFRLREQPIPDANPANPGPTRSVP